MSLLGALTIKVSAIVVLALIGASCLRTRSAAARHWVLAIGVVSACVAPALHVLPIPAVVQMAPAGGGVLGPVVASEAVAAVPSADVVGPLVVTIWLVGTAVSVAVLLAGLARLRWLRTSSRRMADGPWHRLCLDLAQSCGLKRGVDLRFGPRPGLVATWGWWRPRVMLPASASEWSAERMQVVLLHELAHARRGDWILQMAAEALRCVWWFNPLAWMVRARLRRESEHAADDLVLARGVPATTYAAHLVELARAVRKHRRTWLPASAMARPSHLERRLSAMLSPRTNRRPLTRLARFSSLGVVTLIAVLVASLQVATAVEQQPPAEPSESQTAPSRTVSVSVSGRVTIGAEELAVLLMPVLEQMQAVLDDPESRSFQLTFTIRPDAPAGPATEEPDAPAGPATEEPDTPADPATEEPIRIGNVEGVSPPVKIHDVPPVYPPAAREAGVQGLVILEATIDPTGEVSEIEVLKSVPELDEAAIAAVEQWRYEPTLVDGVPVSISMTMTINFSLPSR